MTEAAIVPRYDKFDHVISLLDKVTPQHGRTDAFMARCPAHEDRSPSLSVALGKKWVLLNCFGGCEWRKVLSALNLKTEDLVLDDEPAAATRKRPVSQRQKELTAMSAALDLQNEPGILHALRVQRGWHPKALEMLDVGWDGSRLTLPVRDAEGKIHDFLRYDPLTKNGRKILAGKGKSRLPWPAPESVETSVLFIVEGEGTAISMLSVGLRAVSLPGSLRGSSNVQSFGRWQGVGWHRAWVKRFAKFRQIVLLPDCDGPGRALMGAVRYDLEKGGCKVALVDLGPKTHDGSDVADMLLRTAIDGPSRLAAKNTLREIVAEKAEVLVAA